MSDLRDIFEQRLWWTADVRHGIDGVTLIVRPGARRTTLWRKNGEVFNESVDAAARLVASPGDTFVLCGTSIDETMAALVTTVDGPRLGVTLRGELAEATRVVRLLGMYGLAAKATKRKKAA